MLTVEFSTPKLSRCACCGGTTTRLTRFVHQDNNAFAVYYACFSSNHDQNYVSALVSIGEWGEDAPPSMRKAFYLRLRVAPDRYEVEILNAAESPWGPVEILGRTLDRDEALKHPRLRDVFHITDHIFSEDKEVTEYLNQLP